MPLFGSIVALLYQKQPVLGMIHNPILNDLVIAYEDVCLYNGKRKKLSSSPSLDKAVLVTTDHLNIEKYQNIESFRKLIDSVYLYRTWGDCYAYFLLVGGFVDIVIDPVLSIWDSLGIIPIIRAAGGVITNYNGKDPVLYPNSLIAASPQLHKEVMEILSSKPLVDNK